MSRLVDKHVKYEELSPVEAGRNDPLMQEWLELPISDGHCPHCAHPYWGTDNPIGYFCVRRCKNCKGTWRGSITAYTIKKVVDALMDEPVRLARG